MVSPISFLKGLIRPRGDDLAPYRPLWHAIVALSRDPRWYRDGGVADSVPGRFDAITMVLVAVLLRMEGEEALVEPSVRLTELFVNDMDGQLRESGVGDLVVGKHMGKLMSALGGRLGAYREGLQAGTDEALAEAIARNVTLREGADARAAAPLLRELVNRLAALDTDGLLTGAIVA